MAAVLFHSDFRLCSVVPSLFRDTEAPARVAATAAASASAARYPTRPPLVHAPVFLLHLCAGFSACTGKPRLNCQQKRLILGAALGGRYILRSSQ